MKSSVHLQETELLCLLIEVHVFIRRDHIDTIRQHFIKFERPVESDIDRSKALTVKVMTGTHKLPYPVRYILLTTILVDDPHIGDARGPTSALDRDDILLKAHMIRQRQTIR